ncbi:MAG TPA: hypothetical protein VK673_19765, partial [Chthoniobacterales bacterium]|nr:hypothetical protein [Chthoniobacterales bacterium]
FPGGPARQIEGGFELDSDKLAGFFGELFDIWMERGYHCGVALGPFDALIDHFTGQAARLPCIWKENCSHARALLRKRLAINFNSSATRHRATSG